jgi:RNA-binding protein
VPKKQKASAPPKKQKPRAPAPPLTGKQKSYLRSLAHPLKPLVQIGHQGLTAGVIAAIDAALERHELIKAKVAGDAEVDPSELAPAIEKATHSQLAQSIGRTLVLYRRNLEKSKITLPRPGSKSAAKPVARVEASYDDVVEADDDDELE